MWSDGVQVACVAKNGGFVELGYNGPGLTDEQRAKVFTPFFTTKLHGTGLGLAIARRIVESHGGTITLGSNGSAEFVITVPVGKTAGPAH